MYLKTEKECREFTLIDSILITALFAFLIKLISAWREEIDDGVVKIS